MAENIKPILFSAPMVNALLDGRKTQTRRVITKPSAFDAISVFGADSLTLSGNRDLLPVQVSKGDFLWVRESWATHRANDRLRPSDIHPQLWSVKYGADSGVKPATRKGTVSPPETYGKGRPSIFMPKWASRITLRITDVRIQRLQDINRGDAMEEGCPFPNMAVGPNPVHWFAELWDGLNAQRGYGWDKNPWVAAYTFEVIAKNVDEVLP